MSAVVHVYRTGRRNFGKAGHAHNVAGIGNQKARTAFKLHVPNRKGVVCRRADTVFVVAYGVLRFGNADRRVPEAHVGIFAYFFQRQRRDVELVGAIDV